MWRSRHDQCREERQLQSHSTFVNADMVSWQFARDRPHAPQHRRAAQQILRAIAVDNKRERHPTEQSLLPILTSAQVLWTLLWTLR